MRLSYMMKRFTAICAALLLPLMALSGCGQANALADTGGISVVCTIFPQYDWTRQILGNRAEDVSLTLLIDNGVDLHSFQPSVEDVAKIAACDLFIYTGGESDAWVEDALKVSTNPDMVVINLLDTLGAGAKIEEIIEGMEDDEHSHEEGAEHTEEEEQGHEEGAEHTEEEEHEGEEEHAHEGEAVYDEHVWLSLKNAQVFCSAIADALSLLDAGNTEAYRDNLTAYNEKLSALDSEYQAAAGTAAVKTLLFGDRFPFRYLVDDYGLAYHAAFPGCSAETEASFDTVVFLANKTDELGLKAVIALDGSDQSIANTIISNTTDKNQTILLLDSMQSVTASDIQGGTTYLSVMESNLLVLKEALQ